MYKYDTSIEVTEKQMNALTIQATGIVAYRKDKETSKCYIKVLLTRYSNYVKQIIDNN